MERRERDVTIRMVTYSIRVIVINERRIERGAERETEAEGEGRKREMK